jgi:hypothetical protein
MDERKIPSNKNTTHAKKKLVITLEQKFDLIEQHVILSTLK